MGEIKAALTRLFERHRIVVWTDEKRELAAGFDALELGNVAKRADLGTTGAGNNRWRHWGGALGS